MGSLILVVRREFRDRYPTPWAALGELLAVLLSLGIYWYTARAFVPKVEGIGGDYFSYLVIGEVTLFIPLVLFEGLSRCLRTSANDGTLEVMLSLPMRSQTPLTMAGLALIPREALRAILLIAVSSLVFGLSFGGTNIIAAIALQLLALPVFFGLGLLTAAVVLVTGRGDGILSYVGVGAAILAGTYFPVSVLPEGVQAAAYLSPFTALLGGTRAVLAEGAGAMSVPAMTLLLWGAILLPLGYLALGLGFRSARHRGAPLLFTS